MFTRSYTPLYTIGIAIGLLAICCHCSILSDIFDGFGAVINGGKNIFKEVPDFLQLGINAIVGLPFDVSFEIINRICSAGVSAGLIKSRLTPDLNKMHFEFRTTCNKYDYPILKFDEIRYNPEFRLNKSVVIYASGFTNTINHSDSINVLSKAYNCRGDVNFVAVDAANYVDTLYTWSALNTDAIGENIAKGLVQLTKVVPVENIHLIGHSLGSHIMGAAGRYFFYSTGQLMPRITALDPAKPCFNEGLKLSGLMRGDAAFIDVIHSDPGVLGKREPTGDVDFYPGGLAPLPKGCYDVGCAHARAWQYYAETVYPGNEYSYKGKRCTSLTQMQQEKCPGQEYPMGYAVPKNLKGNYFLEVNGEVPFGKDGNAELLKSKEKCGVCSN